MYKIITIGLAILFLSSDAMMYSNGNIVLNLDDAKQTSCFCGGESIIWNL